MRFAIALALAAFAASPLCAQDTPAQVTLTRLDCGRTAEPWSMASFDDTGGSADIRKVLVGSCYLVRHGDKMLLWDAGIDPAAAEEANNGFTADRTLVDQLARLGVAPGDVTFVGLSHYHFDHTGQIRYFPAATLLIGASDWTAVSGDTPPPFVNIADFAARIDGTAKVEQVTGDRDVFGDGSVMMLTTPGHTPGHHALLVRLADTGPVMLTGDVAHTDANYANNRVPTFNADRADTLASLDRFKKMAANLGAMVIVQHESADVEKLPAFPEAAR